MDTKIEKVKKALELFDKDEMIEFALYFWGNGEGKIATRDGTAYHFGKYIEKKQEKSK